MQLEIDESYFGRVRKGKGLSQIAGKGYSRQMVTRHRKSRLVQVKQEERIKYFVLGSTARSAAALSGVNSKTAVTFFYKLRQIIAYHLDKETSALFLDEEVEVDESYLPIEGIFDNSGIRKGKRGRGAAVLSQMRAKRAKVPVFGLLKRNDKVYAVPVPDARAATLLPIIRFSQEGA